MKYLVEYEKQMEFDKWNRFHPHTFHLSQICQNMTELTRFVKVLREDVHNSHIQIWKLVRFTIANENEINRAMHTAEKVQEL